MCLQFQNASRVIVDEMAFQVAYVETEQKWGEVTLSCLISRQHWKGFNNFLNSFQTFCKCGDPIPTLWDVGSQKHQITTQKHPPIPSLRSWKQTEELKAFRVGVDQNNYLGFSSCIDALELLRQQHMYSTCMLSPWAKLLITCCVYGRMLELVKSWDFCSE